MLGKRERTRGKGRERVVVEERDQTQIRVGEAGHLCSVIRIRSERSEVCVVTDSRVGRGRETYGRA